MQAIATKCIMDTEGNKYLKATAYAGSVKVLWDDALNLESNHDAAAKALILKLMWDAHGTWQRGSLALGSFVYVCADVATEVNITQADRKAALLARGAIK